MNGNWLIHTLEYFHKEFPKAKICHSLKSFHCHFHYHPVRSEEKRGRISDYNFKCTHTHTRVPTKCHRWKFEKRHSNSSSSSNTLDLLLKIFMCRRNGLCKIKLYTFLCTERRFSIKCERNETVGEKWPEKSIN